MVGDPLRGQGALTGAKQRGAGPAVTGGHQTPRGLGGGGVGAQEGPVAGQDHALGAAPGSKAGGDERLGCGDPLGDQDPGGLVDRPGR